MDALLEQQEVESHAQHTVCGQDLDCRFCQEDHEKHAWEQLDYSVQGYTDCRICERAHDRQYEGAY